MSETTDLQARLVNALLAERDDLRNRAEHTGFYAGMTRAITVIRIEMEKLRTTTYPDGWEPDWAEVCNAKGDTIYYLEPNGTKHLPMLTCDKCGSRGVAFICDTPGCPVNGGAYYG